MIRKITSMLIAIALCCPAVFVSAAVDEEYLKGLADMTAEIETLVAECGEMGITPDYEKINLEILRRFNTRMREDMEDADKDWDGYRFPKERIPYNKQCLEQIYSEAKENLTAYIEGTKTTESVPRYVTGSLKPKGRSMVGTAEKDGVLQEERPLFMTGYGHFNEAQRDMPIFQNFGANIIQTEIGPSAVYGESAGYMSWPAETREGSSAVFAPAPGEGQSGAALKITNPSSVGGYKYIRQSVKVNPNTSYEVGFSAKAPGLPDPNSPPDYPHFVRFVCDTPYYYNNGDSGTGGLFNNYSAIAPSDDYKEWKAVYKTGPEQKVMTFYIGCFGQFDTPVLIDDAFVRRRGRRENMLLNPGFEPVGDEPGTFGKAPDKVIPYGVDMGPVYRMQDILKSGEENNIAVSLLLSSHYFPEFIMREEPSTRYRNDKYGSFMPCNINHPTVREVEEKFIDLVVPYLRDYKSLNNFVLSNEPFYQICHVDEKYYKAQWEEYLKRTYSSISELNQAHRGYYTEFSDVPLPSGETIEALDTLDARARDFCAFNNEQFGGFHKFLAECAKRNAPSIPVHAKMLSHVFESEWTTWRYAPFGGTCPDMFAEFTDISGNDAVGALGGGGKWQNDANNWWRDTRLMPKLMWHDLQRSIKAAPIYNSEDHLIWDNVENYMPQEAVRMGADIWQSAVHGRNMDTIWLWEVHRAPWGDFSDSISTRPDCIKEIGDAGLDLNRLAYEVTALQNKRGDAAVCYSETSRIYSRDNMSMTYQTYKAMLENGQKVDFVTDTSMKKMTQEELNKYPMLVLPEVTNPSEEMLEKIENYTGTLICIGDKYTLLARNEKNQAHDRERVKNVLKRSNVCSMETFRYMLPSLLRDNDMLRVELLDANGSALNNVEWQSTEYNGKTLINICSYDWDNYNPWDFSTDIRVYVDGKPAIYGKDLISGEEYNGSIGIKPYQPRLLEIGNELSAGDITLSVDGEKSIRPAPGDNAANVTVTNSGSGDETMTLYIALYDGKTLKYSAFDKKTVAAGGSADFSACLPGLTQEDISGGKIKAFLWKDDMKPITKREF